MNIELNTSECIEWIKEWYEEKSGGAQGVVIGISGGKDSAVVASLLVNALGKDRVFGVLMPNGNQKDIDDAYRICEILNIKYRVININEIFNTFYNSIRYDSGKLYKLTTESQINILPRIRMTILYAIAQSMKYRVVGTGNASEHYIGYFTKWGDGACDFNPIANFTSDEVICIGKVLGIPDDLIKKSPSDGLCGKSDEENFGFSYQDLNKYINTGECDDYESMKKIEHLYTRNLHKILDIPVYQILD